MVAYRSVGSDLFKVILEICNYTFDSKYCKSYSVKGSSAFEFTE